MLVVEPRAPDTDLADIAAAAPSALASTDLDVLFAVVNRAGYRMIGPTVNNGVIVYAELNTVDDLPNGDDATHAPGLYSLQERDDAIRFGGAVGPTAWKRFLYPPDQLLWRARREGKSGAFRLEVEDDDEQPLAFLGVRACDLAAIQRQDEIYGVGHTSHDGAGTGVHQDPEYVRRRESALIIAVNCTSAAATCFCASLGTGPRARNGYDLALTEILEPEHYFLVEVGSPRGRELAHQLPLRSATTAEIEAARAELDKAAVQQTRQVDVTGLKERLQQSADHPHWEDVAGRCLACGNCTMVCPTCFCMGVEDSTDLTGEVAERRRVADSCFNLNFAYVSGGSLRTSTRARYRQWLTHKFAHWVDQYGTLGCVGCGRCITWCPVGIDITHEVAKLRSAEEEVGHEHGADTAAAKTR